MPVRSMLGCALHERDDNLPGLSRLARRSPLQGSGINATRCQTINNQIAHRRTALADANSARTRERVVFFRLNGSLEALHRADLHPVLGGDLRGGGARTQQRLDVTRSESRTSGRKLHPRTVTARRAAELVRDQHRVAFTLGIGEHQGLAISAGPEQFELNHHFLLIRLGRIVSNNAENVA